MSRTSHAIRIGLLMALAAVLLGWLSAHTESLFADGLRYIRQAREIDRGSLTQGLLKAIDHPCYPLAIVAAHRAIGGESPEAWQAAAQAASSLCGILLVIPLYLIALELFGARSAWLGVLLTFAVPATGRVLADTLSEATFLLFWSWGLWTALRFLRRGTFGWLLPTIAFSGLAYLTRPEGLLLPAALVAALIAMPLLRSTRLNWPRWWAAFAFLVIGPALLIGPYVAIKGGLGTKPAIARVLGTAPTSASDAVERARLLDPDQSALRTYAQAGKAMMEAVRDAASLPLLPFAALGLILASRSSADRARAWLLLAIIGVACALALIRLHATGGYCTPRHALVPALLLIPAAAYGLDRAWSSLSIPGRLVGQADGRYRPGPALGVLILGGLLAWMAPATLAPVNTPFKGYHEAGAFLAERSKPDEPVADVSGLALYYAQRQGYTFADIIRAPFDPHLRWVVVRDAHLNGPWPYCRTMRELVGELKPVRTFPEHPKPRQAVVYVYERAPEVAARQAAARAKAEFETR